EALSQEATDSARMGFSATSEGLFSLLPFQDEDDHNYPYTDHGPCGEEVDYPRGNGEEREREGVCRGQVGDGYHSDCGCLGVLLGSGVCSDLVVAGVEASIRALQSEEILFSVKVRSRDFLESVEIECELVSLVDPMFPR